MPSSLLSEAAGTRQRSQLAAEGGSAVLLIFARITNIFNIMAKGNLFLGKARGKVGDVILSNLNGVQIARAYQPQVKNPQTSGQAAQRAAFATCAVAGSLMGDIVNHSFDGVKEGADNRNEFVKVNLNLMREIYKDNGYYALNTWVIPKGAKYVKPFTWMISRGTAGDYQPKDAKILIKGAKYADLKNEYQWLRNGAQMTWVMIEAYTPDPESPVLSYRLHKSRIVFNSMLEKFDGDVVSANRGGIDATVLDLPKCENVKTETNVDGIVYLLPTFGIKATDANEIVVDENSLQGYPVALGIIGTVYESTRQDVFVHTTSRMTVDTDRWDDTNENISTYEKAGAKIIQSDYYTDQPTPGSEDTASYTLEELVTGLVGATGMKNKAIRVGANNSYGPVAEGTQVFFDIEVPTGWVIQGNTFKIYNGDKALSNEWIVTRISPSHMFAAGPMPTTASFPANITFDVYDNISGSSVGKAALKVNVSKVNE